MMRKNRSFERLFCLEAGACPPPEHRLSNLTIHSCEYSALRLLPRQGPLSGTERKPAYSVAK